MIGDGLHDVPPGKLAMVVTHLEMTERASLRDAPLPSGLTFAPLLLDLATYRQLIRDVGQDWLWFSRLLLSDEDLLAVLHDPLVDIYTLVADGTPAAILELDFRSADACELAFFGVTERLIGTGSGAYLMDRAIDLAWSRDISRFHVHTCSLDSPQALGFYIRSGFAPYKLQIEIADDPRLSGLLPSTAAPQTPIL